MHKMIENVKPCFSSRRWHHALLDTGRPQRGHTVWLDAKHYHRSVDKRFKHMN